MTTTTATKPARVALWDNSKVLIMVLVATGHILEPMRESTIAAGAYLLIYSFHMPVMMFISGYLSKNAPLTKQRVVGILQQLLVPYVIFQALWNTVLLATGNIRFTSVLDWSTPRWTLWFLLALIAFRLLLPYVTVLKYPITFSLIMALMIGFTPGIGREFTLSRIICLLPIFLIGWKMGQRAREGKLSWLAEPKPALRMVAAGVFALAVVAIIIWIDDFTRFRLVAMFYYSESYADFGLNYWAAPFIRLSLLTVSLLLSVSFVLLVTRRHTWFTISGNHTMYMYLLHTFAIYFVKESLFAPMADWGWLGLIAAACIGAALCTVLASKPVRMLTRPFVEPRTPWLFHESAKK